MPFAPSSFVMGVDDRPHGRLVRTPGRVLGLVAGCEGPTPQYGQGTPPQLPLGLRLHASIAQVQHKMTYEVI